MHKHCVPVAIELLRCSEANAVRRARDENFSRPIPFLPVDSQKASACSSSSTSSQPEVLLFFML